MKRLILASLLAALASPVLGQSSPTDEILAALKNHGYRIVLQERTWLGRERIVAETVGKRREVVFNPGTGEILRDYVAAVSVGGDGSNDTAVAAAADSEGVSLGTATTGDEAPVVGSTRDGGSTLGDPVANPVGAVLE